MKLEVLINRLDELRYEIGGFSESSYYLNNKENDIRVGIYVRRSKGDKKAIDNQTQSIKYIVEEEFGVDCRDINTYIDNGVSGTADDRPAYLNLKMDLEHRNINTVIVANIDRLGRTTEVILSDIFPEQKIKYLFISLDNKLINGLKNRGIILKKAEQADSYAAECSEKSKRGLKGRMKSGSVISSKAPYGYEIINSGGVRKFILGNPVEVQTVRNIFNMYLQGKSMSDIANWLSGEKVETPSGKEKWGKTTIESILKNPLYYGELYQGRFEKQGYSNTGHSKEIKKVNRKEWIYGGTFEAIIDKVVFNMVKDKIEENKSVRTKDGDKKLFTAILKCAECGRALVYRKKSGSYQCAGTLREPYDCRSHLVSELELKKIINEKIKLVLENGFNADVVKDVINKIELGTNNKALEFEIKCIDEEIDSYINQVIDTKKSNCRYTELLVEGLYNKIDELKTKKDIIEGRITYNNEYEEKMKFVLRNIHEYNVESNDVYRLFIKQIRVSEEYKIEIDWRC